MSHSFHVGLIGRPNVGKSTLYNRLTGKRQAVVADQAGTTRDRIEGEVSWGDAHFTLVDMAGLELELTETTELTAGVQAAVERGIAEAELLLWVVDARLGVTAADEKVAEVLRRQDKPVVVVANQCDDPKHDIGAYEFARFGFEDMVIISALHGRGVNELLEAIATRIIPSTKDEEDTSRELRLAIVGRPNVGKSTLLNALAQDTRSVVSPEAGTTRDAVDTVISAGELFDRTFTRWSTVRVIDTAGIRRRGKMGHEVEAWSVVRTYEAIDAAEVVLFLIDVTEGMVHQDLQVAEHVVNAGRGVVLVLNKWDVVLEEKGIIAGTEEEARQQERFLDGLRRQVPFLHWVQVVFMSAKTGLNLHVLGKLVLSSWQSWALEPTQEQLTEVTEYLRTTPRLKNLQQVVLHRSKPPVFHLHVEGRNLPHFSTNRFVENVLRDHFNIGSSPIKIWSIPSIEKRK